MSDLSDISTENPAAVGSPTDNTMMHGATAKTVTSSLFSEQFKNTLGKFFPFTKRTGTGDEMDTREEDEDNEKIDDFEYQVILNCSTHENEESKILETGYTLSNVF